MTYFLFFLTEVLPPDDKILFAIAAKSIQKNLEKSNDAWFFELANIENFVVLKSQILLWGLKYNIQNFSLYVDYFLGFSSNMSW